MKTYYKNIAGEVHMMLDSSNYQVDELYSISDLKSANIVIKESYYNKKLTESTDTTKWRTSDETSFNNIKSEIISSFSW